MHEKTIHDKAIKMFATLITEILRPDFNSAENISVSEYSITIASRVERLAKILTMEDQERK